MRIRGFLILLSVLVICLTAQAQNERDLAVRKDKQELADDESWFYDDLDAAMDAAREAKRPLMIVFR